MSVCHIAKTKRLWHGDQPDRCYTVMAAIIACRRPTKYLPVTSVPPVWLRLSSTARAGYFGPSSPPCPYGDGNPFLPDCYYDHSDTVGLLQSCTFIVRVLRPTITFASVRQSPSRRLPIFTALPHRSVPAGLRDCVACRLTWTDTGE